MTKEDFLLRARESHGYKYNYPNLNDKIFFKDILLFIIEKNK
jgi:hypothetical protein